MFKYITRILKCILVILCFIIYYLSDKIEISY
nr:MAG TPA: hypothetical protein [Caudoviricetes sp.]